MVLPLFYNPQSARDIFRLIQDAENTFYPYPQVS